VRILAILKSDRFGKMSKMIGERTLPVLQDSVERGFQDRYAASPSAAFYFFDAEGCLIPNKIETGPKIDVGPEVLRQFISQIPS
jgi:hypothetical protein